MANEMRDRLVELIKQASNECNSRVGCTGCKAYGEGKGCFFELIADHLIENGVVVPQWISVKDRLPNEEERVLVAVDSDKSYTKIDTDRMIHRQWVRWGMSVTHWMPLPEPPTKEGADNG